MPSTNRSMPMRSSTHLSADVLNSTGSSSARTLCHSSSVRQSRKRKTRRVSSGSSPESDGGPPMPDGSPAISVVAYRVLRQASLSTVKPPAAADTVIMARSTRSGAEVAANVGIESGSSHAPANANHRRIAANSDSRRVQEVTRRVALTLSSVSPAVQLVGGVCCAADPPTTRSRRRYPCAGTPSSLPAQPLSHSAHA